MANKQGDVDLRKNASLRPQLELWFGLAWSRSFVPWFKHSFVQFNARHIKRHISRRKKQHRTVQSRCLMDRALHRWAELSFQQHSALQLPLRQPPRHTVYLWLPPAPLGKVQWHLPILTT